MPKNRSPLALWESRRFKLAGKPSRIGEEHHQLVNFDLNLTRSAPLGPETPGGNAIIEAFRVRPWLSSEGCMEIK